MLIRIWLSLSFVLTMVGFRSSALAQEVSSDTLADREQLVSFVELNCLDCHDDVTDTAGLSLESVLAQAIPQNAELWEKVVRKLATRQMPPSDMPRPDEASYEIALRQLTSELDAHATRNPTPGRTASLRRMTRSEYRNAVRDLLAVEVDVTKLIPADESSHGFDNVTVTGLSPTLINRYAAAAEKISRLAVGRVGPEPDSNTFRVRPDITQDRNRVEGLPLGTRGGTVIDYTFPADGEYLIQVWLMRDRNDEIEGLRGSHTMEVLVDRERMASFEIARPPRGQSDRVVDANLKARIHVTAGAHDVAVTFVKKPFSLLESERQPLNVHYNFYRHPRLAPAVYQVQITGPFDSTGLSDSTSREKIFTCRPDELADAEACAKDILAHLMRQAYRRPLQPADLETPLKFFRQGMSEEGSFDVGIERALASILISPHFLFRVEQDPVKHVESDVRSAQSEVAADTGIEASCFVTDSVYRISDLELASRLSFFLWSSLPDETLLRAATSGELSQPAVLNQQVRRMLADQRSQALVNNFADQWLYLRNLESVTPNARLFPDFGHNLRAAFRRETELLFEDMLREDRSVLTLLDSPYTYLNERLARHYGIPHVYGSRFRRVEVKDTPRGGILRHGSILSVTSYATRTSPVLRGTWVLENILGTPPPPPPPNVPALEDNQVGANLPVRERLAAHRANQVCAQCHDLIDPVGFGLENFDPLGRWRELELGQPVDARGSLADGSQFDGVAGLEQALLKRPELFVQTLTEKLLTYSLGRGVEHYDAPAVRKIVRDARDQDYRFSSLVHGIVQSVPFQMRALED